ncbi:MAG: ATP-binding protein [Ruminococcus sp.]|nr:ATP-binding protein [Ruminococcus sp.]
MIKKIRSRLSIKVFFLTFLLTAACCVITYLCIARFAPYIYKYEFAAAEEIMDILVDELYDMWFSEDAQYVIQLYQDVISNDFEDEFVIHVFQDSGEEVALSDLESPTGARLEDYQNAGESKEYKIEIEEDGGGYTLLLTKNTKKESQIIEALQKSLPVLSIIILAVSVIAAFFYTWYMTRPIKKISRLSRQMADMDFSGLCPVNRSDEIGVLSQSLNELSGRLVATLTQLQEANRKLQADIDRERELERQRTAFFSAASHELKTPITIIKGQLQGMLYQVGRYQDRETYLAQSLEVTGMLEKMVQELLTISRLDTPGYTCHKSVFDLSGLLLDRLAAYEDFFMQKELTVEKDIPSDIVITGDRQLLQKVLDNLLGNAAAYSGPGNTVSVKLWQGAAKVNLMIENTGVYIPEEDIPRLFEAFYRVDQSRNRQTGGTGLGLYIVKTILDLHEAEIEIANSARGVIVWVRF